MNNNQAHIDQIIKEKLGQFQAPPPEHVWAGIEQGLIDEAPPLFFAYAKQLAAAAVLVIAALAAWYFIPVNESKQIGEIEMINESGQRETENIVLTDDEQESRKINTEADIPINEIEDESNEASIANAKTPPIEIVVESVSDYSFQEQDELNKDKAQHLTYLDKREVSSIENTESWGSESAIENTVVFNNRESFPIEISSAGEEIRSFKNYWNIGLYFTPEMMFNNIDSVTLMNTYSLNIEPSWYFSKHWFMRFGAGVSYVRDRGFANVDYLSEDFIGSYDSVYNITFEDIGGEVLPVYHTKEVDIWDSVRHLEITEITNSYYYLQFPLMFGYHNSTSKVKWYFYGGPAMNISIHEQIEDPKESIEFIEVIDLENRLPNRTDYSVQLWVGAGIDFRIGQKFSLAFEPNYRYYFEPVFKEDNYKTALSGLGLRFGLVYKLDRK